MKSLMTFVLVSSFMVFVSCKQKAVTVKSVASEKYSAKAADIKGDWAGLSDEVEPKLGTIKSISTTEK